MGRSFSSTIFLTTEDVEWYATPSSGVYSYSGFGNVSTAETGYYTDYDFIMMNKILETLNQFIAGEIYLSEQELDDIESYIEGLRAGY